MSATLSAANNNHPGTPFVGREPELAALREALSHANDGNGRIVLASGEPGIGKTRLAEWLAAKAREAGAITVWGRCYEGEGAPAFWPWSQILRGNLSLNDADTLRAETGADAAHLAQIVPEIGAVLADLDSLPAMNPEQARFRLFDAVTRILKQQAAGQPLAIILEDLHWADEPSLLLLQFLAGELRGARLLVFATYRNIEVQRHHPLSATLANLVREPVTERITLHRFTPEEVGELIEQVSGTAPTPDVAQAVWRETEGNPFFVTEVVRLFDAADWLTPARDRPMGIRIPESIRDVIGQRLDRLSAESNELLAVAAVAGREFDLPILESATSEQAVDLFPLLDEASRSQVIEDGHGFGRYRFSHRLIQETLYDEIPASRRYQLHSQIGASLEERHAADLRDHYGILANHYSQAPLGSNIDKAIEYATKAAEQAMRRVAWEQAVSLYELALQMLELQPDAAPEERCDLLLALGSAQDVAGSGRGTTPGSARAAGARSTYWQAVEAARAAESIDHFARAAIGASYGPFAGVPLTDQDVVPLLEEVLAQLPDEDSIERALAQAHLAAAYRSFQMYSGIRFEAGTEATIEQLSAEAVGDPSTTVICRIARHTVISHPSRSDELRSLADELLSPEMSDIMRFHEQHDDTASYHAVFRTTMSHGDVAGGKQLVERMITRTGMGTWSSKVFQAGIALSEGRYEDAEALIEEADATWPNTGVVCNQTLALCREQDRLEDARPRLASILEVFPQSPWLRMIWILYLLETGEREEAQQRLRSIDVHDLADLAIGGYWSHVLAVYAELSAAFEDEERARACYELLKPYPDHVIYCGYIYYCAGSISHYLGLLSSTFQEWSSAEEHFAKALEQHQSMGFHPLVAYTQLEWARMLLQRGEAGDRERAGDLLNQSLSTARRLGMVRLERLARELMADVRPDTGGSPAGLSPRETEVIALVVEGMTNAEIGETLYISPRTVSQHLRSVYTKLNVNNRAAAVARWVELAHQSGEDRERP